MVEVEVVEVEKISRSGGSGKVSWKEYINKGKLAEILSDIMAAAEVASAEGKAIRFDARQLLEEVGYKFRKENVAAATVKTRVQQLIRDFAAEIGAWDKRKFSLGITEDDGRVYCVVRMKKTTAKQ